MRPELIEETISNLIGNTIPKQFIQLQAALESTHITQVLASINSIKQTLRKIDEIAPVGAGDRNPSQGFTWHFTKNIYWPIGELEREINGRWGKSPGRRDSEYISDCVEVARANIQKFQNSLIECGYAEARDLP